MKIKEKIKNSLKSIPFVFQIVKTLKAIAKITSIDSKLFEIRNLIRLDQAINDRHSSTNPLNKFGKKCFSQADEDGITLEILKRIACLENGTFAEFGIGDGTENNTLVLKALGWRGFWIGGENLAFEIKQPKEKFTYFKSWITLKNIYSTTSQGLKNLGAENVDVASLDLDGNDFYFVENLLQNGFTPKLFIVEYNAKFPPPINWKIDYDESHTWCGDDYFGASLTAFTNLFETYGYILVCCNKDTGSNAFYVKNDYKNKFDDVPNDINLIYVPPNYFLHQAHGHCASLKTIENLFK